MRTYLFEGKVIALTSIHHGGGEHNSIVSQLRREKFIQPDYSVEDVPVISGNAVRGVLRDVGMFMFLKSLGYGVNYATGEVKGLPLPAFYFLFSGGSLVSGKDVGINVEYIRKMREYIPLISIFGGAIGNVIIPGKLRVGKLIPICLETKHLIPERLLPEKVGSIWDYCQQEFYTRRDDEKNDNVREMIAPEHTQKLLLGEVTKKEITGAVPQQMMYYVESLAAGTQFYWKILLEDANDIEFEAMLLTLVEFSKISKVGGKSNIGLGEIAVRFDKWMEIDSRVHLEGKELDTKIGQKYEEFINSNKDEIKNILESIQ